ncbi:CPCC family cysteine-rich protein [Peribacillus sp. NJ11]|uniref:CPCC family cysteine-rich protein n=1 Tax=Peribacillus sp. NJ11 TaxID=3055861 RepID=UPI0025A0459C|nr:CPCC family cysteine-rich protein [Peribacillus sp. NJ11]MDM5219671.1 CPCC family cysteine-rich protein [Peribacillus sp. NJ11]
MQREKCLCCGFPTLDERGGHDICELCNWEDDGQNDLYADEVWGGPNGDYSLTEARRNFNKHLIMYRDKINILSQTDKKIETKKTLIRAFVELDKCESESLEYMSLWSKIKSYEEILNEILHDESERYSNNIENNKEIFKLINSDDMENVINGLLELAVSTDDPDFVQDIMFMYSEHEDANIRGTAILCLGRIAKVYKKINKELVLLIINQGFQDESGFVREQSRSALDDINFYIK